MERAQRCLCKVSEAPRAAPGGNQPCWAQPPAQPGPAQPGGLHSGRVGMGKGLGASSRRGSCGPPPDTSEPLGKTPLPAALGPGGGGRARSDSPTLLPAAKPTPPVVSGPSHRVTAGQSVSVTCTAGGFFPKDISVKWLKDEAPVSAQQPQITPEQTKSSYKMSSTVTIPLQKDDVRSQLVCEVQHPALMVPLKGIYQLSKALRGEGWVVTSAWGAQLLWGWGSWGGDRAPCGQHSRGTPGTRSCFSSQSLPVSTWSLTHQAPLR